MFGFEKKQIDIILEKFNFSPGETIRGKVCLSLNKPIHAKQLRVALIGEKIFTRIERRPDGRTYPKEEKLCIYNFQMPLDGEKEYLQGEYGFEIKIPTSIPQNVPVEGKIGTILRTIQALTEAGTRISWYVQANLDIRMGFDVSKKIQINVV
jgi:hypothetical protein